MIQVLRDILASAGIGFRTEQGEFGPRLVLQRPWSLDVARYMLRHEIKEIRLNADPVTKKSVGDLRFLAEVPMLVGLVVLDHTIRDLSPINSLARLRSLSLGRTVKSRERSVSLLSLPNLERLYLSERLPNEDDVFLCTRLERLKLTKYPGKGSSESLSRLTKLQRLSLIATGLSEIRGTACLLHLERLELSLMKHLASLEGIENLGALRELRIESCPHLHSIEPLRGLTNLTKLWLYDCGDIPSMSALGDLLSLEELNFGGNTNIVDGDLSVLTRLPRLASVAYRDRKHYSHHRAQFRRQ